MIEILCECNWDIRNVESLPPHLHRSYALCQSPYDDKKIRFLAHDARLNPDWVVLDEWDEILFSVPWKELAREDANG